MNNTKKSPNNTSKMNLHPRNKHRDRYDFPALIASCPALAAYIQPNPYNNSDTIDFADPNAVKTLNKAILSHFYGIKNWDIPPQYLCPPIPGRADYLHYMADLLAESNNGVVPTGKAVRCLDIGVGANCVYPMIGHQEYGWSFVGTDIDPIAIKSAKNIVEFNPTLKDSVDCRLQKSSELFFEGVVKNKELFDLTVCNPPFHASMEEANAGTIRKQSNLTGQKVTNSILNFGGKNGELWCDGGENKFIWLMIKESVEMANSCFWFSTLVSKKENLVSIYKSLQKVGATDVKTIEMSQGQKVSRVVAWTFLTPEQQTQWAKKRWQK
jgi:23S rRNA (adenine1618-N6)-methyltransferase